MRSHVVVVGALVGIASCGGSSHELPPAPEPAVSPALTERPAGTVVRIGHKPEGLAFDERTGLLAVGLANPDRLALVDGDSGRVVRRVPLPESPRHLRLADPGGPVLGPAEHSDELVRVSLPDGRVTRTKVGDFPHDATAVGERVFVGDEHGDSLSVVERGRRVRVLDAPVQPGGVVATTDGRHVGVVGVRARALEAFDARTLESIGRVDVGIGPTHVEAGLRRFFVVDTRGDALIELRLDPLRFHRRVFLQGAPYGIAHDRRRGRFWVTLTERNEVALVTPIRSERTFPTVRQPNSVAVDERTGRVWVAGRGDGVLQFFDP
jgi:DNA-binding beta-propeller fold protein YncE